MAEDSVTQRLMVPTNRRVGIRVVLGLLGLSVTPPVEAKRRKRCQPACPYGQYCLGGSCYCNNGGTRCESACCVAGQSCQAGQCITVPTCNALGQPCAGTGRPCCSGLTCGSGQGGMNDVACYVPAGQPCDKTGDCLYQSTCLVDKCIPDSPTCGGTPCGAGYKVVLEWSYRPMDLDTYFQLPDGSAVYHGNRGAIERFPWAYLDRDTVVSYRPERLYFRPLAGNSTYSVSLANTTGGTFATSGAIVRLYRRDELVKTYEVPTIGSGSWWDVFVLNEYGTIYDLNTISDREW